MKIGKYTTLEKICKSETAIRHDIDNIPDAHQLFALKLLVEKVYDPLCDHFQREIPISSGFRSFTVNKMIGGATSSQHTRGEAFDLDMDNTGTGITNSAIFYYIYHNIDFDQIIWEYGTDQNPSWVHVSFSASQMRKQVLRIKRGGRYETYTP